MKRLVYALLLLVSWSTLAAPFPVTNTRYAEAPAWDARLTTNGRDAFVLWTGSGGIKLTRIVEGEYRVGRPVLAGGNGDIVWTGQFFLVVAEQSLGGKIVGRLVDARGEPVAGAFTIVERGATRPRVAWNGRNVLLVYGAGGSVVATLLTSTGAPVNGTTVPVAMDSSHAVASNGSGFAVISASPNGVHVTTLEPHGAVATRSTISTFELENDNRRPLAIASNGSGYLAVWSTHTLFDAVPVNADGTLQSPFSIGRLDPGANVGAAAVTWTGTEYAAAFIGQSAGGGQLFVARASTHSLQSLSDGRPASSLAGVSLLRTGGRTLMTYTGGEAALLLADASQSEDAVPVTFAAPRQDVGTAASSATATLVAWNELLGGEHSMHVGVRGTNGTWVERRITREYDMPLRAATDGSRFLVVALMMDETLTAFLIDAQARVLARIPLPLSSSGSGLSIASNGQDFAVAYTSVKGQPTVVRVNRNGVASPPQTFSSTGDTDDVSIASHGTGFLLTWYEVEFAFFPPFEHHERILALRLRSDFTAIDPAPVELADHDVFLVGSVARDGAYEVFWVTDRLWPAREQGLVRVRVPASGPVGTLQPIGVPDTNELARQWEDLRVGPSGLTWTAIWSRWSSAPPRTRYFDWRFAPRTIPTPFAERVLLSTPDGRLAWVGHETQDAPPHHGVQRLMFYVPDSVAAVPDAPRATLTYDGRELRIEWDAPAQPVMGYRVEYRIGDGNWNEFPRQYGADERSAAWTAITHGKSYAFRVRAFGESGAGAYSEVVRASPGASKRRAVR